MPDQLELFPRRKCWRCKLAMQDWERGYYCDMCIAEVENQQDYERAYCCPECGRETGGPGLCAHCDWLRDRDRIEVEATK